MKKLHYLGKKMKDVAQTRICLKVRDLLHAVGKKCGVDPGMIDGLDLENVVERTIAIQEGREPPPDQNEDSSRIPTSSRSMPPSPPYYAPSPQEDSPFMDRDPSPPPCPDLIIRNPIYHSLSNELYSPPVAEKVYSPQIELCQIAMPSPISDAEETIVVLESPPRLEDIQIQPPASVVRLEIRPRSATPEEKVPKRFREKKEMYGRDPQKLYDTYKEEWHRLERLSGQK
ncbi:hypothetical protein WR25_06720 [Diploscapter pachys]|uniref:Uncharacterized protein n=1 Tax=Diploscapter pachys TaxID=2018661 RepID=A0A2A2M133_9BILA|nr:hypothetical protein WR25_06720 [Diploscapter pachys]